MGVDYRIANIARLNEACRTAADDEALFCGTVRCTECADEHLSIHPFPDWAAHPMPGECEACGKMAVVFVLGEDLVRIPSRRQGGNDQPYTPEAG